MQTSWNDGKRPIRIGEILGVFFMIYSFSVRAEEKLISLAEIATTQTAVGKAEIDSIILEWAALAENDPESFRKILQSKIHDRLSLAIEGPNLWKGRKKLTTS